MRGKPATDEYGLTQSERLFADRVLAGIPGPDAVGLMPAKKGKALKRTPTDEAHHRLNQPKVRRYMDHVRDFPD